MSKGLLRPSRFLVSNKGANYTLWGKENPRAELLTRHMETQLSVPLCAQALTRGWAWGTRVLLALVPKCSCGQSQGSSCGRWGTLELAYFKQRNVLEL